VNRRRAGARFRRAALLTGVLAVGLVPAVAAAGADGSSKTIGDGVRLKGSNVCYAHGKAVAPRTLYAMVVPVPPQG